MKGKYNNYNYSKTTRTMVIGSSCFLYLNNYKKSINKGKFCIAYIKMLILFCIILHLLN